MYRTEARFAGLQHSTESLGSRDTSIISITTGRLYGFKMGWILQIPTLYKSVGMKLKYCMNVH